MNDLQPVHSPAPDYPVVMLLLAILPGLLLLTGTVMGFRALHDIRVASGALGGAMTATLAAGLVPALFIVGACAATITMIGQSLGANRMNHGFMIFSGSTVGVWLSFLMMRGMHRGATGWTPPVADTLTFHGRSLLATAAIVLTIAGAGIMLLALVWPPERLYFVVRPRNGLLLLDLPVILAGLICGVLSHRETAGKTCAWICGALFVVLLLLFAA